jgi:hypothetical protein
MAAPALPRRLLFLGFMLLGAASGFFVGSLSHAMAAPNAKGNATQHNTLFVLVNNLQAEQPALEGIWLAARVGEEAQINWMPIYPLPLNDASPYSQAHSPINLVSNKIEDLGSLAPIRSAGIWFDEVFMLDEAALSAIGNLSGAAGSSPADAWAEPQGALQQQVELINNLCAFSWSDPKSLDQTLALIPSHLRSSLSPFDLIARWDSWSQAGFGLSCTHPWAN